MRHEQAVDVALQEALVMASGGIDFDETKEAIKDAVQAVGKQMAALKAADYAGMKPADIARSLAHTIKGLDELYRLMQFAKGAPDSRPDLGQDWLRGLTDEQLAVVQRMLEENEQKGRG